MQDQLESIVQRTEAGLAGITSRADWEAFKATIVGPNGAFTEARKLINTLPKEEKPAFGKRLNEAKDRVEALLAAALGRVEDAEMRALLGPAIDPTLPAPGESRGSLHPITQIREEICAVFRKIGFTVADGPEVETDWFCFEALNVPADHPARDMQDTYFLPADVRMANVSRKDKEPYLMRTHTSPVQIRTLLAERPPLRIISPGRCFRRDSVDATHSANFHQVEGLYVDRDVTVRDLKAVLDHFVQAVFGAGAETRLRPSFFPFTEPSFEMDFRSPNLGKLSNRWLEIMGCGMVDPAVLENAGLDPAEWSGYAFGMGVERIAMILTGADDIRHFYQNDLRFLGQFA